jgi:dihydropyrimidinase
MLHHHGVRGGRLSLNRLVELFSTGPAQLFGLYPKKGAVAEGSDGDVVIFDPEREVTISAADHHSNVDYNVFEGTTVRGAPEVVLVRGQVVIENDELVADPGHGRFLSRPASP